MESKQQAIQISSMMTRRTEETIVMALVSLSNDDVPSSISLRVGRDGSLYTAGPDWCQEPLRSAINNMDPFDAERLIEDILDACDRHFYNRKS